MKQLKIKPIITEKTMSLAKNGKYTFSVPIEMTKPEIKQMINKMFKVNVREVRTINMKPVTRRNIYRKKVTSKAYKKAFVRLTGKEKIDLFTEEK